MLITRKLVLKWHPDKHPTDREQAETKNRAINEAYDSLGNPTKKEVYDGQRRSVLKRKRTGARVHSAIQVKTDLPRESIIQPIGYPDKFVRYRARLGCLVHSRVDARNQGIEEFSQSFNSTKLSFWWLPAKGNMCRIRAVSFSVDIESLPLQYIYICICIYIYI